MVFLKKVRFWVLTLFLLSGLFFASPQSVFACVDDSDCAPGQSCVPWPWDPNVPVFVCSSSGPGMTTPTCNIRTNKQVYDDGDQINFWLDAGDNGETFLANGTTPTVSGACNGSVVGWCGTGNLCTNRESQGMCSDVCGRLYTRASNSSSSVKNCTITATVANMAGQSTCSTTVEVNPGGPPNLRIISFSIPNRSVGQTVNATVRITNSSSTTARGTFEIAIDRNGTNLSCTTGTKNAVTTTTTLAGNASRTLTIPLTLPNQTGNFTAESMVDSKCQVSESNENDNTRTTTYSVTGTPDLTANSCSVPGGTPGQTVTATVAVQNTGSGDTGGGFEVAMNRDGAISCAGVKSGSRNTRGLGAGNSRNVTFPITLPSSLGNFTATAMVDSACGITESREGNNKVTCNYSVSNACSQAQIQVNINPICGGFPVKVAFSGGPTVDVTSSTTVNVNSNQDYTLTATPPNGFNINAPNVVAVPGFCSGVRTVTFGCEGWKTFFETFGGDVMALGNLNNRNVPGSPVVKFFSDDFGPSQEISAGMAAATSLTTIASGGKFSSQNAIDPLLGWNMETPLSPDLTRVQYDNLLTAVLKYGGLNDVDDVCVGGGGNVVIGTKRIHYRCYSGNITNLNGVGSNTLVLLPNSSFSPILSGGALGLNEKVILFVDKDLLISSDVKLNAAGSGLGIITRGKIDIRPDVKTVDGLLIADTIDTGSSTVDQLAGTGMLIGGTNVFLNRVINPDRNPPNKSPSEIWTYEPRYLDWFRNILSKPTLKWRELPGK